MINGAILLLLLNMNKNFYKLKTITLYSSLSLYNFSWYSGSTPYKRFNSYTSRNFIAGLKTYTKLQHISDDLSLKRAILNFVKCVAQDELPDIQLNNYRLLLDFLQNYDPSIYIAPQNFAYYKRVEGKIEIYRLNSKVSSFIEYVKDIYPDFSEEWIRHDTRTYIAENDPDSVYSKLKPGINSGIKSTTRALKHIKQNSNPDGIPSGSLRDSFRNRNFSILASTYKRCYSMSYGMLFPIIKSRLGYRYKSNYTHPDNARTRPASLIFDRSDHFINNLDKKDQILPVLMPDLSEYKLEKDKRKKIKQEIYGLHGWNVHNNIKIVGTIQDIRKRKLQIIEMFEKFLKKLDDDVIYKMMVLNIREGKKFAFGDTSFFVSKNTNPDFLYEQFLNNTNEIVLAYKITLSVVQGLLASKVWLKASDVKQSLDKVIEELEKNNKAKLYKKNLYAREDCNLPDADEFQLNGLRGYDNLTFFNYGNKIDKKDKVIIYKKNNYILHVTKTRANNKLGIKAVNTVKLYDGLKYIIGWTDTRLNDVKKGWVRAFEGVNIKFYYKDNIYNYMEKIYKTEFLKKIAPDTKVRNWATGTLDIETYSIKSKNVKLNGLTFPYACGYKYKNIIKKLYIERYESPVDLIVRMLETLILRKYAGRRFYVHNLAGFDSRFILAALGKMGWPIVKLMGRAMNEIFYIKVSAKVNYISPKDGKEISRPIAITFVDSNYIQPGKLSDLSRTYAGRDKGDDVKDVFPHLFMSPKTLFYKGEMPARKYYENSLTLKEYKDRFKEFTKNNLWDAKKECFKYLEKDLVSLENVMHKFNQLIFDKFKVDATKILSYSALSKAIFLVNYYNEKSRIPIIKGFVDSMIRKSYIGGIVDVIKHIFFDAYKYDVNSHYPAQMLNDMPVGFPRLTDNKDLNKLFGFVKARVTAPTAEILPVPILPIITPDGRHICPRGRFEYTWFSEELKNAVKYGYKVEVISAIVFDRGLGVFKDFILIIYRWRLEAKKEGKHILAYILKLILNSLYGKTGQKMITDFFKFIDIEKLESHKKIYDTDLEQIFSRKVLVRDHGMLNAKIRKLINSSKSISNKDDNLPASPVDTSKDIVPLESVLENEDLITDSELGEVDGSVCIAAAVTAYGRIYMSQFKNIPGNPYFGGDTDSVIMQHPLPAEFVDKEELGKMKLESEIAVGLAPGKKLYYLKTKDGEEISKSRGIGIGKNYKSILKEEDYIKILAGDIVTISKPKFIIKKENVYYKNEKIRTSVSDETLHKINQEIAEYIASTSPRSKSLKSIIPRKIYKIMKRLKAKAKT